MVQLPCRNEPNEYRFKEAGDVYTVLFRVRPGHTYGVTVFYGEEPIDYRPGFMGSNSRDCAKNILEQTLFDRKHKP